MPRFKGPKSAKRNSSTVQLDALAELDATEWGGYEMISPNTTKQDYCRLWHAHGEAILKRWIETGAGSRPWVWYIATGTPPPPPQETSEAPLRVIDDMEFKHAAWHGVGTEKELKHLQEHNAVSSEELKAASIRLSAHNPPQYVPLAQPTPTANHN